MQLTSTSSFTQLQLLYMQHIYNTSIIRSDEGLTLETSALYSLRWPIYIFNLVDITKLPCYPHRRSTTVSLETFTLYSYWQVRWQNGSQR